MFFPLVLFVPIALKLMQLEDLPIMTHQYRIALWMRKERKLNR